LLFLLTLCDYSVFCLLLTCSIISAVNEHLGVISAKNTRKSCLQLYSSDDDSGLEEEKIKDVSPNVKRNLSQGTSITC